MTKVLVVIVSTNDASNVVNCLECLARGSHQRFSVVITENGGQDGFSSMGAALAGAPFTRGAGVPISENWVRFELCAGGQSVLVGKAQGNLGYAGGTNHGIQQPHETDWDAVWVLNPDTFPEPDAMRALVVRQIETGVGMVGSRVVFVASGLIQTWGGHRWNRWLGRAKNLGIYTPIDTLPDIAAVEQQIDCVCGASMYVTRACTDRVGAMDEDFFVYCEDLEWTLRAKPLGIGYAHGSIVRHIHGATSGASGVRRKRSRFNVYLAQRNKVMLERKLGGPWVALRIAIYLAGTIEYLVLGRSWSNFVTALQGWAAGMAGERGMPAWMRASSSR